MTGCDGAAELEDDADKANAFVAHCPVKVHKSEQAFDNEKRK